MGGPGVVGGEEPVDGPAITDGAEEVVEARLFGAASIRTKSC